MESISASVFIFCFISLLSYDFLTCFTVASFSGFVLELGKHLHYD